jgi:ABC-type multidrug transport system permease subunit
LYNFKGLLISTIFTTEVNAHQVTMIIFYPVLLLSGIVWPLEGQPTWMRVVTKWLPITKATEAMRGIHLKGTKNKLCCEIRYR